MTTAIVTIAEAISAEADPDITSFAISDSPANIAAGLATLPGLTKLASITTTDAGLVDAAYAWFAANLPTVALFAGKVLDIHDVPASQAVVVQANANVSRFSVADAAAEIGRYFSTLNARIGLDAIAVTDGKPILLTASQFTAYTSARSLVVPGTFFTVINATVAAATGLEADATVAGFTVTDTVANLAAGLDTLAGFTRLTAIRTSGGGSVVVSHAWFTANPATVALFVSRVLDVHDVPASQASAAHANAKVLHFSVADTAAEIGKYFPVLNARSRLDGLTVTDGKPIGLTASQFAAYTFARSVAVPGTFFTVSDATVAAAAGLEADVTVAGFTVTDTVANLAAGLDTLAGLTRLTAIRASGAGAVVVSHAWFAANPATVALFVSRVLDVHDVPASQGGVAQGSAKILRFSIADTAAEVGRYFSSLNSRTRLDGIAVTDGKAIPLTRAVFVAATDARSHVAPGTLFAVSFTPVAEAAALEADPVVASFAVADTSAAVLAGLADLAASTKLSAIRLTDGSMLSLTLAEFDAHADSLAALGSRLVLGVTGVPVARASELQALAHVRTYTVADTAANLAASFATLNSAAVTRKLVGIDATDDDPITLTNTAYRASSYARRALTGGTQLFVTDVAASLATTTDADPAVAGFTVRDSAANVIARLPELSAAAGSSLTKITLTTSGLVTITGDAYAANAAAIATLADGTTLYVSNATMASVPALVADPHVALFSVADTYENVHVHFDDFQFTSKLHVIHMTDPPPLVIDIDDYDLHSYSFRHFASNDFMTVSGVPVNRVPTLLKDSHVSSIAVRDTVSQIHENLDYLHTQVHEGLITGVEVTDGGTLYLTPWEAAAFDNLVSLMTGSFTLVVTDTPPPEVMPRLFNLVWEDSAATAPAGFVEAVQYAADYLDAIITTRISVNVRIGYGEVLDQPLGANALAATYVEQGTSVTYDQFRTAYQEHIRSDITQSVLDNMVAPPNGRTIFVGGGQAEALGLSPATIGHVDAEIGFALDPGGTRFTYDPNQRAVPGKYDFISVAIHEMAHSLGRLSYGPGITSGFDMLRFASPGVLGEAGTASYFSTDGGTTHLMDFALKGNGDWSTASGNDTFSFAANAGTQYNVTPVDLMLLDAMGYTISPDGLPADVELAVSPSRGLAAPVLSFIGTPDVVAMDGIDTTISFAMQPDAGILQIDDFVNGRDVLTLDLTGMTQDLIMYDMLIDGRYAIALVDGDQRSFGVILTDRDPGETAADLLANHYSRTGDTALIF